VAPSWKPHFVIAGAAEAGPAVPCGKYHFVAYFVATNEAPKAVVRTFQNQQHKNGLLDIPQTKYHNL
jgi:hypothetical protein